MGRARKEELSGEAMELAENYNKRIAELQKKRDEALRRLKEKTEKFNIKLLKQFIMDINEICDACKCDKKTLNAIAGLVKEHKEELEKRMQEEDVSVKKENPRAEGLETEGVNNIFRTEGSEE